MGAVEGYEKVPGSSRRYRNVETGETISRRQFDNLRIQRGASPFQNRSEIERYRSGRNLEAQRYARTANVVRKMSPVQRPGLDPDDLTSEYTRLYVEAKRNRRDLSPDGPLAQFLKFIGLREPDDSWDVGETQIT